MKSNRTKTSKGFMLLLAILISAIIITIGLGISNFILKELILASTARNSLFAFYAADTGIECSHYWDDIFRERGGSVFDTNPPDPNPTRKMRCDGKEFYPNLISGTWHFNFSLGDSASSLKDPHTYVAVTKTTETTTHIADGYNTNDENSPKRVERTIRSIYTNE